MDVRMRIGELSRRTGVSPELLRAWERRYGLLRPSRSEGGFRLYSPADEARVRRVTTAIASGLSASEAARQASSAPPDSDGLASPIVDELALRLRTALDAFEPYQAHAALDRLLAVTSVEAFLADVVIPYLHDLGARWEQGLASVAQEHFASNLLRGRLLALARDRATDGASRIVLACPPGESHDLALLIFAILLARRGWAVTFLGADTPFETLLVSVSVLRPNLVVLAALTTGRLDACLEGVRQLVEHAPVAVAGPVDEAAVTAAGARLLGGDIVAAAASLSR